MALNPNTYKSGFVAVTGHPNVGKSTLINLLVGTKIAAVSAWPQTTRKRQMGILTQDCAQIIFIDTPGVHKPLHRLGRKMNEEAAKVIEECDLILLIVDASVDPTDEDQLLAELLVNARRPVPAILALNKIDLIEKPILESRQAAYQELFPQAQPIRVSAIRGDNQDLLVSLLIERLPQGPPFFPEDQLTDLQERDIAGDLIREAALNHLWDEVPHSIAIRIDEYTERGEKGAYIGATLFVERESQKAIVIGQNGAMLKKIGTGARQQIELLTGRKIYLKLRVKVRKNWRNDEAALQLFGFEKE